MQQECRLAAAGRLTFSPTALAAHALARTCDRWCIAQLVLEADLELVQRRSALLARGAWRRDLQGRAREWEAK
jgi:hypothetical protein